jgi:hypothetical protein
MKVAEIIDAMGGRASVARLTGVGAAQISHMFTRGTIPAHHIRLFIALRPELDWIALIDSDSLPYIPVLTDKGVQANRFARVLMNSAQNLCNQ